MAAADVVAQLRDGRLEDVVREAVGRRVRRAPAETQVRRSRWWMSDERGAASVHISEGSSVAGDALNFWCSEFPARPHGGAAAREAGCGARGHLDVCCTGQSCAPRGVPRGRVSDAVLHVRWLHEQPVELVGRILMDHDREADWPPAVVIGLPVVWGSALAGPRARSLRPRAHRGSAGRERIRGRRCRLAGHRWLSIFWARISRPRRWRSLR
jgi:hypothetical protein